MVSAELNWAKQTSEKAKESAKKAFDHTPEMPRESNNFDAFLGTYDEWKASLLNHRVNYLFQEKTDEIPVYGPLDAITPAQTALLTVDPSLNLFDPTEEFEKWLKNPTHYTASEAHHLFHGKAAGLFFTESGGKIAQIEARMAMAKSILTGQPLWIDNQKPPRPEEKGIGKDDGKIWRSRQMVEADAYSLQELYGKNIPLLYTTNRVTEEGIVVITRGDAQQQFIQRANGRRQRTHFTPRSPYDEIVISGSSNDFNANIRSHIQEVLQTSGNIRDTRFTSPDDFAKNLPWSKVYENTLVTGNYTAPDHLIPKPPLINIVDAEGSYGDLSQAALLILHAIMQDTYVLFYTSKRNTVTDDDFLAFQSMLRELVVIFPETTKHVRITQSMEELVQCVSDIREIKSPTSSLRGYTA